MTSCGAFSLSMASKKLPFQAITAIARPACRRAPFFPLQACSHGQTSVRHNPYSTSTAEGQQEDPAPAPRWKETPPAMKAPVRLRAAPGKTSYKVNSDPAVLDRFYIRMFGEGGDKLLSDETKWQCVTHKSFDQGRRGYNSRLAQYGKEIIYVESSLSLIRDPVSQSRQPPPDPFGRTPVEHPALRGLEALSSTRRITLIRRNNMAALAKQYGLHDVLRWVPRMHDDLTESGIDTILTQTMYAIIGAVALEKGGLIGNQITRERILKPLGFNTDGHTA